MSQPQAGWNGREPIEMMCTMSSSTLCRMVSLDKQLVTVGRLSRPGAHSKQFATDPKFVVMILVDSIEGKGFQKDKDGTEEEG